MRSKRNQLLCVITTALQFVYSVQQAMHNQGIEQTSQFRGVIEQTNALEEPRELPLTVQQQQTSPIIKPDANARGGQLPEDTDVFVGKINDKFGRRLPVMAGGKFRFSGNGQPGMIMPTEERAWRRRPNAGYGTLPYNHPFAKFGSSSGLIPPNGFTGFGSGSPYYLPGVWAEGLANSNFGNFNNDFSRRPFGAPGMSGGPMPGGFGGFRGRSGHKYGQSPYDITGYGSNYGNPEKRESPCRGDSSKPPRASCSDYYSGNSPTPYSNVGYGLGGFPSNFYDYSNSAYGNMQSIYDGPYSTAYSGPSINNNNNGGGMMYHMRFQDEQTKATINDGKTL